MIDAIKGWAGRLAMQQAQGVLRHVLSGAGAWLIAQGYADQDQTSQIIGGIVAATAVLFSVWQKHEAAQAAKPPTLVVRPTPSLTTAVPVTPAPAAPVDDLKGLY